MQELPSMWASCLAREPVCPDNLKKAEKTFESIPHFLEQFLPDKTVQLIFHYNWEELGLRTKWKGLLPFMFVLENCTWNLYSTEK